MAPLAGVVNDLLGSDSQTILLLPSYLRMNLYSMFVLAGRLTVTT